MTTLHRILLIAGLLATPAVEPAAQAPSNAPRPDSAIVAAVRRDHSQRLSAMVRKQWAALDTLLADDLTYGHATGRVDSKATLLGAMRNGALVYERLEPQIETVAAMDSLALVRGRGRLTARAGTVVADQTIVYLAAYRLHQGRWKLTAWQSTTAPSASAQRPGGARPPQNR
jgi:hypothetical protein